MFKRPIIRPRSLRGPSAPPACIPPGAPGRVGEIADAMRRTAADARRPRCADWRPHYDYEFVAKYQADPAAYIARALEWLAKNPPPPPKPAKIAPAVDFQPIHDLFSKYPGQRPPIDEHVAAMRKAGYSEQHVERAIARDALMNATADERQEKLDAIFARWPSINKPTPKPRPNKPIKAVKKKMT